MFGECNILHYGTRADRFVVSLHVPQEQMVGGVFSAGHFGCGRRPEVLVTVAAGYQQQFAAGRAHLALVVQRLPSQFRDVLWQVTDQCQEPHVARVTMGHAWEHKCKHELKTSNSSGKKTKKKNTKYVPT